MKFINEFEKKFEKTASTLFTKKDRIIVACSGGKDSTSMLYLLHKFGYNVEAVHVNLLMGDYSKGHVDNLTKFCLELGVKLHIVNIRDELGASMCYVRARIQKKMPLNNCMICGVIKRSLLNKKAKELHATKIVTGHNLDDLAESVLMNVMNGNPNLCLGLDYHSGLASNELFAQRVKPFNYTPENDIRKYSKLMKFPVIYDPCPCSSNASRRYVKNLIDDYEVRHKKVKQNIAAFLKQIKPLIKSTRNELRPCTKCGEPSSSELCQSCRILQI